MKLEISAGQQVGAYWRDIWNFRELIYILAWRDVAVRYKQTAIGILWALLRPGLTMLAFVGFRRIMGSGPTNAPEALVVLSGVLPWQFFAAALSESSGSLIGNSNLISKVYFPRLVVPMAAVSTSLIDLLINLALFASLMLWYGYAPWAGLFLLPVFIIMAFGLALGGGFLLSALNVEYRDFRYVVPFLLQFGLFVCPVAFTTGEVPPAWRPLFEMNPLVGIIEGFRWCLLQGDAELSVTAIVWSLVLTTSSLTIGVWYFRRVEQSFADVI